MLARAELQLLLLSLVGSEERHGYDLIRAVKHLSRGAYVPSSGVVYPALAALEAAGHVVAHEAAEGRRTFSITTSGAARVAAEQGAIDALKARLDGLVDADPAEQPPIRRAMDNLWAVLANSDRARARDGAQEIAALIDEAAGRIERLG